MTLTDFINKWTGKPVDTDGVYPNQCMDLMHQYVYECLGLTDKLLLAAPSAYQVFTAFKPEWGSFFEKIDNTPTGVPEAGDLVFWDTTIGPYGHVAIFCSGDANKFSSFDSNWPVGTLPHAVDHDYHGVCGWLHPKAPVPDDSGTIPVEKEVFESLVKKSSLYDGFVNAGFNTASEATQAIQKLVNEKNEVSYNFDKLTLNLANVQSKLEHFKLALLGINGHVFNNWIHYLRSRQAIRDILIWSGV